jgi:hypothetical protein
MPSYNFTEQEALALRILCDREIINLKANSLEPWAATISARDKLSTRNQTAQDSPRYSYCQNYGDHHSDRHTF